MNIVKLGKKSLVIAYDLALTPIAWLAAYWLRFNLETIPASTWLQIKHNILLVLLAQTTAFIATNLYRSMWRFASLHDLLKVIKSIFLGCSFILLTLFLARQTVELPRSIIPNYAILLSIFLCSGRVLARYLRETRERKKKLNNGKRVLIIGAGQAGESIVRDMLRSYSHNFLPVAFLDDKPGKQGQEIHGIRVVGKIEDIAQIVKKYNIEHIVLAMPSISTIRKRKIIKNCRKTGLAISTLPSLSDLVTANVGISSLREISIEDLIGREAVEPDWDNIKTAITDKVILVTGGGGSIGSELCRQIAKLSPKLLIAIDNCEYNLFLLEQQLINRFPELNFAGHLVDIKDQASLNFVFNKYQPEIVFHAAAYKHVPLLQNQVREGIFNNVLGTFYLVKTAVNYNVQKFIMVSTDKAVNPANYMGATKRIAEIICQYYNKNHQSTKFVTVRFGNVLGSAGSVVPIFRKQIENGGPITITHPKMTRFFMTIPEAASLILQSFVLGKGGEIFVLDMGEPVKIQYLAEQMITLSGRELGKDIEIEYTGLRPGEKLFEELFHESEILVATRHNKILLSESRDVSSIDLELILNTMESCCQKYNIEVLLTLIKQLVPELKLTEEHFMKTIVDEERAPV